MNFNTRIHSQSTKFQQGIRTGKGRASMESEPTWLEYSLEYAGSCWRTIGFRKKPLSVPGCIYSKFDNTIPQSPAKKKGKDISV